MVELKHLSLDDKELFDRALRTREHELSVYAFANIYIWQALFEIRWAMIDDALCLYFQDAFGMFLYLPPLVERLTPEMIAAAYAVMDAANTNAAVSRIDNIEELAADVFRQAGYACTVKGHEYICLQKDLAELKGNKYKSKRACCNYAATHYGCSYRPYVKSDAAACMLLYEAWMQGRMRRSKDHVYRGMLTDSQQCLRVVLELFSELGCAGRVVEIDGNVRGFTFGYAVSPSVWCVLYEVTDLAVKGLAQYIFREFCREMPGYRFINVMDDSGLENLRGVKMSYHPARLAPMYTAKR